MGRPRKNILSVTSRAKSAALRCDHAPRQRLSEFSSFKKANQQITNTMVSEQICFSIVFSGFLCAYVWFGAARNCLGAEDRNLCRNWAWPCRGCFSFKVSVFLLYPFTCRALFFDEICGSLNFERWTPYHFWLPPSSPSPPLWAPTSKLLSKKGEDIHSHGKASKSKQFNLENMGIDSLWFRWPRYQWVIARRFVSLPLAND